MSPAYRDPKTPWRGARYVRRAAALFSYPMRSHPRGPSLRILTYHRVNATHPGDRLTVHPDAFAWQMEHLKGHANVVPLAESWARVRRGEALAQPAVAVTFDDGYRDNFDNALPVLDRLSIPATFFVVSGNVGTDNTIERYRGCCDEDGHMSWQQVSELVSRGHAIGSHGKTHRELGPLGEDEARKELLRSRADILRETGKTARLFCYPRGSQSAAVRRLVSQLAYEAACTVYPGVNDAATDPFALRRTEVSGDDAPADVRLKLLGAYDGFHRIVQTAKHWRAWPWE